MCLGIRGKSARRIGGRVSSDTYLAPQFDPTKTPGSEDYLRAREAGKDVFDNGHPPASPKNCDKDLVSGTTGSVKGTHVGVEYGPYWGYSDGMPAEEYFVSVEFPRGTAGARKSFSELLMETETLERGPLALAAMAAAAERAARLQLLKEGLSTSPGFQGKEGTRAEDNRKASRRAMESFAPYSMPLQDTATISSLSKQHVEASKAVAAFKERRRQSQLSSSSQPKPNPSYLSTLFRSSRKRSIPHRAHRSFQRPLSPVPESLSLDEGKRKSDVSLTVARESAEDFSDTNRESSSRELGTSGKSSLSIHVRNQREDLDDFVLVERTPEPPTSAPAEDHVQGRKSTATSSVNGRILEEDSSSKAALEDDATSKVTSTSQSPGVKLPLGSEGLQEDDSQLLRTPVREFIVTPEVFISPKTTSAEYNFRRVNDMDPEERPIFGSLADHWEAAWATKRPAWDGRGILNDTNKYSEDQKVMWHAVPFEERLAQALATQEDLVLPRRNSFKSATSRLSTSRSNRSLRAH